MKKTFWKKYEKPIVILITLLIVFTLALFSQKINFFLGNELVVSLTPAQKSFGLYYGNKTNIEFDLYVYNSAQCRTLCEYEFADRSRNESLDKGNFELDSGQHFKKTYELSVKRLGRGQEIYSFEAECHSIRSLLCLTSQPVVARNSFITVDYDLTEEEKKLKEGLRKNITELLLSLSDADIELQKLNQKYFELAHKINLNSLSKEKIETNGEYDNLAISVENLRSIWAVEKYEKLSSIFNESFFAKIEEIKKAIADVDSKINGIVELHNGILHDLEKLSINLGDIERFANALQNEEFSYDAYSNANNLNSAYSNVVNNTFENYTSLTEGISALKKQQLELAEKLRIPSAKLFFEIAYVDEFNQNLICSLRQDCTGNVSISRILDGTLKFIEIYPDASLIKSGCGNIIGLEPYYSIMRNESGNIIANKSISFPGDENFISASEKFRDNLIRKINNSYYISLEEAKGKNDTNGDAMSIADSFLPRNLSGIQPVSYNQSLNISLYLLSKVNLTEKQYELMDKCAKINTETKSVKPERISANITYNIAPKVDTALSDNPPICCVFNECEPCCTDESCRNNPKTFPVILLHGHSFAKSNSPEYSLDSFNKLQSKLQEEGYLNAGIVSLYSKNEPVESGAWGLSGKPVAVKASYYYDAFRKEEEYIAIPTKSENIDTYAIRLKEIIEIVKSRTSKPKVNIVAHSMGGLVARRYIQIFGDNDVNKLVMIATPNHGLKGYAADYCGLVGENRECMDMLADSLFINKLNDPSNQPKNVKLYSIIGDGCSMKNGQGDGIVLKEGAELENAELHYINGTCEGLSTLHTDILDIEKYPETYRIVRGILGE